jgi:hypothetical protein
MHRRTLPVVACPLVEQVVADGGHCRQCDKRVHDLSAMTQRQARRFLRRNRERSICVAYRAAPDGRVRFRPSDAARRLHGWSLPMLLGALGGCASLGRDLEVPDDVTCLQHRGQRVDCDEAYAGYDWQPEVVPAHEAERSDEILPPGEGFTLDDPPSHSMDAAGDPTREGDQVEERAGTDSNDAGHEELGWDDDIMMGGVLEPREEARSRRETRKWQRKARRTQRRAARGS